MWVECYSWYRSTNGRTPVDMGLATREELDPRYFDAMMVMEAEVNRLRAARGRPRQENPTVWE